MAEQETAPAAQPAASPLDVGQLKTMLNLPETATDVEIITALVQFIGQLQQKYDALLSDAVQYENKVANSDVTTYTDVISPGSQEFWKEQLLKNRDGALSVLHDLRKVREQTQAAAQPQDPPPDPQPRGLFRNRIVAPVRTMADLAGDQPPADSARAVKIRNRAQEIRSQEKVPYALAFARAEKEIE